MLSRFHLIPERHGDGQTHRQICYINITRQCANSRVTRKANNGETSSFCRQVSGVDRI